MTFCKFACWPRRKAETYVLYFKVLYGYQLKFLHHTNMFNDRSSVGKHHFRSIYVTSKLNWKTHILLVLQRFCLVSSGQDTFHYYFSPQNLNLTTMLEISRVRPHVVVIYLYIPAALSEAGSIHVYRIHVHCLIHFT